MIPNWLGLVENDKRRVQVDRHHGDQCQRRVYLHIHPGGAQVGERPENCRGSRPRKTLRGCSARHREARDGFQDSGHNQKKGLGFDAVKVSAEAGQEIDSLRAAEKRLGLKQNLRRRYHELIDMKH